MKYIGIDIGSSYVKSAVIDLEEETIIAERKLSSPVRLGNADSKTFEVSAQIYVKLVRELIDGYTAQYSDIRGVVFSTQMHGFVYRTDGKRDIYVSWQDMRCLNARKGANESYMAYMDNLFPPCEMERCGVPIKPSLGMCNLYAMLDADEDIRRDGELFTIGSYIIHDLTGNNLCHITNAAPLGLADVIERKWDDDKITKLGFDAMRFPKIVTDDRQRCGYYISNGLKLGVFPDYGDQQVSILGSDAGCDEAVINIATSSQVSVIVDAFCPGDYEVRPYFEDRYINTISNMPGGRVLNVLVRFLRDAVNELSAGKVDEARIWDVVHKGFCADSCGIRVDTSFYARPGFLNGGAISGILPGNLNIHTLFSAAYNDMACMYHDNIRKLRGDIDTYVCAGGVSWKTPELIQVIERISSKRCRLSPIADESLSGLYQMALICDGGNSKLGQAKPLKLAQSNT